MKKFFQRGGCFLLTLCLLFLGLDVWLTRGEFIEKGECFHHNDFEKTLLAHGSERVCDKIFFGNSVVISSYVEWASDSGYVNFGMDTNPTYPGHRGSLEPYLYFQRDRLQALGETLWEGFRETGRLELPRYGEEAKFMYSGQLDEKAMAEKVATHRELYWGLGLEHYGENLAALGEVIRFCRENGIRLRAVWLPWNPTVPMPEGPAGLRQAADKILAEAGIEVLDMEDGLAADCFHDVGHLNMEYGAFVFTEVMDPWLKS